MASFVEQLQRNTVALISVAIAITSLAYNTWRNEVTEGNRNIRVAGMEIIQELAQLQQVVFFARFEPADFRGDARVGWAHVLAVHDYAEVMPGAVMGAADGLVSIWQGNFQALSDQDDQQSYNEVDGQIEAVKAATLAALAELD
jgi:hypothetical protein